MQWMAVLFAVVAGVLNTVQSGSNVTLHKILGQPVWAAVVVYVVGLLAIAVAAPFIGVRMPAPGAVSHVPWWGWLGGAFGAFYIFTMLMMAEKLGAAIFQALTVTAAIVTSLAMDHYGWMGFEVHKAGIGRLAGGACMIIGLFLIAKF
ncbi:MAG: DMT family transporter [Janthinobacterium lividum]